MCPKKKLAKLYVTFAPKLNNPSLLKKWISHEFYWSSWRVNKLKIGKLVYEHKEEVYNNQRLGSYYFQLRYANQDSSTLFRNVFRDTHTYLTIKWTTENKIFYGLFFLLIVCILLDGVVDLWYTTFGQPLFSESARIEVFNVILKMFLTSSNLDIALKNKSETEWLVDALSSFTNYFSILL